jgi:dipeptidyl aminopeptidase/acylaminoacyl peptidase
MKKHLLKLVGIILCASIVFTGCTTNQEDTSQGSQDKVTEVSLSEKSYVINSENVQVESRGIFVPATLVTPKVEDGEKFPLVVISHGHGGSREENGGLTEMASTLASKGIASIRMDYSGCGESTEAFTENNLTNMIKDTKESLEYALANVPIDESKLGAIGYSMGGRVVLDIITNDDRFSAAGFLAPGVDQGELLIQRITGGEDKHKELYEEASSDKGYADFTTKYGSEQMLSKKWFDDLTERNPMDNLSNFKGDMLIVCGTEEAEARKTSSKALYDAAKETAKSVKYVDIEKANHGYGFWNGAHDVKTNTVNAFADFFVEKLK